MLKKLKLLILFAFCAISMTAFSQVEGSSSRNSGEDDVFMAVEEQPQYPGGSGAMMEFINKNKKYPQTARNNGIKGRVFVSFIIEKDGSVSNIKIVRGIGSGCDEEAIRVIRSMPKWKPGKQRGEPVRVQYTAFVNFE